MSLITPRKDLPVRTIVGTDIMDVQESTGITWYKITLNAIKDFVYTNFLESDNTFTGDNTFSNPLTIPDGVAITDAVNKDQLDEKQDSKIYQAFSDTDKAVKYDGVSQKAAIGAELGFLNLAEEFTPSSSSDTAGVNGDITHDRDYMYMKSSGTWKRSELFASF